MGYASNGLNGMMPPTNYGGYAEANSYPGPQPQPTQHAQPEYYPSSIKPQIYTVSIRQGSGPVPKTDLKLGRLLKCLSV